MGLKVTYKQGKDNFPEIRRQLDLVNGSGVEVGVLKGEHKWLAGIHEYGCTMTVTKKQRRYMAKKGLILGKTLTIPERSFLRTGYDKNKDAVMKKAQMILADVMTGKTTARGLHQAVGLELSSKIKDYAVSLNSPPNHPFTVDQKGSSNPLVDTGDMIGGITWRKAK